MVYSISESRSSHEERGLKSDVESICYDEFSRSSHEERGLKSVWVDTCLLRCQSLLSRGAWIEMEQVEITIDNEQCRSSHEERGLKSPFHPNRSGRLLVAPLTRSVD